MSDQLFIQALRSKLRFTTGRGELSTEDLFELSLASLDALARGIHNRVNEGSVSFISSPAKTKEVKADELRLEIAKQVIQIKQEDAEESRKRAERRQHRTLLKDLLAKQEQAAMAGMSAEDLRTQLAALALGDEEE